MQQETNKAHQSYITKLHHNIIVRSGVGLSCTMFGGHILPPHKCCFPPTLFHKGNTTLRKRPPHNNIVLRAKNVCVARIQ